MQEREPIEVPKTAETLRMIADLRRDAELSGKAINGNDAEVLLRCLREMHKDFMESHGYRVDEAAAAARESTATDDERRIAREFGHSSVAAMEAHNRLWAGGRE